MKISKILLLLVITVSIVSCKNDDDNTVEFTLSNTNIAGTHELTFFTVNQDETREFNGIPVTSNTSVVGDTFQVTAVFGDDGTYTLAGQYRVVITITVAGVSETDSEIIVLNETGTYQIDGTANTISFSGLSDLGAGSFDVALFNQAEMRLTQMESVTTPDVTSIATSELRFARQ